MISLSLFSDDRVSCLILDTCVLVNNTDWSARN